MDKRIANLYHTARSAGVCLDGPPPDSGLMLQAVVYLWPGARPAAQVPIPAHHHRATF